MSRPTRALAALLAIATLASCGDDSDDGESAPERQRSADAILRGLPPGYNYQRLPESAKEAVLGQAAPDSVVDQLTSSAIKRVVDDQGQVMGVAMALVTENELGEDDVLRGFEERAGQDAPTVMLGGKDGRIVTAQGLTLILDVAGREMVAVGATTEADARRMARGVLLD